MNMRRNPFLLMLLLTGGGLTGCQDAPPWAIPNWEVELIPQTACVNDTIRLHYHMADDCPADFDCTAFYPTINLPARRSDGRVIFPMRAYHVSAYNGYIESSPIPNTEVHYQLASTTPATFLYRRTHEDHGAARGTLGLATGLPAELEFNTIPPGGQSVQPIVFDGQCLGNTPGWTSVSLETREIDSQIRSESVQIRRLCNREMRWIVYTANFTSGLPSQSINLGPNECRDITSETPPTVINSITARPLEGGGGLDDVFLPMCRDTSAPSPPAPISAEITYGCQ